MSMIDVLGRSTALAQDFQARRAADNSLLLIDQNTTVERFSIELTVGSSWSKRYGHSSNGMMEIPEEGLKLGPRESIVIEVTEQIGVPFNMYGLVIPTGSLFLDRGIIIAAAKIEPSFNDRLKLRLVNTSDERHLIKPGQKVASAIFFSTELTVFREEFHKGVARIPHQPSRWQRLRKWVANNPEKIAGWIIQILFSSVAAVIFSFYVLSRHGTDNRATTPPPPAGNSAYQALSTPTPRPS